MGELRGTQLEPRKIAALCYDAGWTNAHVLADAVKVCLAESQGYDHAVNENPDGSVDRGMWQLNSIHAAITDEIAYDPEQATKAAYSLWKSAGESFQPWVAYSSHVFLRDSYVKRADRGVANYLAERDLARATDELSGAPYVHSLTSPICDYTYRVLALVNGITEARIALATAIREKSWAKVGAARDGLAATKALAKK